MKKYQMPNRAIRQFKRMSALTAKRKSMSTSTKKVKLSLSQRLLHDSPLLELYNNLLSTYTNLNKSLLESFNEVGQSMYSIGALYLKIICALFQIILIFVSAPLFLLGCSTEKAWEVSCSFSIRVYRFYNWRVTILLKSLIDWCISFLTFFVSINSKSFSLWLTSCHREQSEAILFSSRCWIVHLFSIVKSNSFSLFSNSRLLFDLFVVHIFDNWYELRLILLRSFNVLLHEGYSCD
jgi:hypothetical protein